jgi:hypothetical protein
MLHRRCISALLLAVYLPACTAYHTTDRSPAELTAGPTPVTRMCVTTRQATPIEVSAPRVTSDSPFGTNAWRGMTGRPGSIPPAINKSIKVRGAEWKPAASKSWPTAARWVA